MIASHHLTTCCHRDGTVSYQRPDGVWCLHKREIPKDDLDALELPDYERERIERHLWRGMAC